VSVFLNVRQKIAIGISAGVIFMSFAFVLSAPAPVTPVIPLLPGDPVPSASAEIPVAVPLPVVEGETLEETLVRVDQRKAAVASDMAMALVAQVATTDYRKGPEEIIQAIRGYTSNPVLQQVAGILNSVDWDSVRKEKYWLHAEIVSVEPLAPASSRTLVPTKVRIVVDLFEVDPNPEIPVKVVGQQTWEVGVGQGEGKNGWVATSLALID
jgi:hypothetical protein